MFVRAYVYVCVCLNGNGIITVWCLSSVRSVYYFPSKDTHHNTIQNTHIYKCVYNGRTIDSTASVNDSVFFRFIYTHIWMCELLYIASNRASKRTNERAEWAWVKEQSKKNCRCHIVRCHLLWICRVCPLLLFLFFVRTYVYIHTVFARTLFLLLCFCLV